VSQLFIGVGNIHARKQITLNRFHSRRFIVTLVIISEKVKDAMDDKVPQMVRKRFALRSRLLVADAKSESNVSQVTTSVAAGRK